jgi:hypothetical protein
MLHRLGWLRRWALLGGLACLAAVGLGLEVAPAAAAKRMPLTITTLNGYGAGSDGTNCFFTVGIAYSGTARAGDFWTWSLTGVGTVPFASLGISSSASFSLPLGGGPMYQFTATIENTKGRAVSNTATTGMFTMPTGCPAASTTTPLATFP